jgi:hypothetical protein
MLWLWFTYQGLINDLSFSSSLSAGSVRPVVNDVRVRLAYITIS